MNDQPPVRIVLRPLGSPLTIGAAGLCMASLVQSGLDLHWIAKSQAQAVGLILVSVPFLLQALACVLGYLARDGALGSAVGTLSTSWLAIGLVRLTSSPGSRSGALGLLLLAAGALLLMTSVSTGLRKPLPATMIALAGVRFALTGIYELGAPSGWQTATGIAGLAVVAVAGYCVLAFELEDQLHRPLLPTFRRDPRGAPGTQDEPAQAAVDGLTKEAGVRPST